MAIGFSRVVGAATTGGAIPIITEAGLGPRGGALDLPIAHEAAPRIAEPIAAKAPTDGAGGRTGITPVARGPSGRGCELVKASMPGVGGKDTCGTRRMVGTV